MWDKVRRELALELDLLDRLMTEFRPIMPKIGAGETPGNVELLALAAILHSFYVGVENVFKRIAVEVDGGLPHGAAWHRKLADSMADETAARGAVISRNLHERLQEYLRFRHVFRHAYTFYLDWEEMAPLVLALEETLRLFQA